MFWRTPHIREDPTIPGRPRNSGRTSPGQREQTGETELPSPTPSGYNARFPMFSLASLSESRLDTRPLDDGVGMPLFCHAVVRSLHI